LPALIRTCGSEACGVVIAVVTAIRE